MKSSLLNYVQEPLVSVVMPVYNIDEYLEASINSILEQTYKNLELIIVCTNPSSRTLNILNKFLQLDNRIDIIYQKKEGIIKARNECCMKASGKYIAIMDGDDVSCPERVSKQVDFLEKNPDVGVVGSWYYLIDSKNKVIGAIQPPLDPVIIKLSLIFEDVIGNSSAMIRKDLLERVNYYSDDEENYCEDYDLWLKSMNLMEIANIGEYLIAYRVHESGISSKNLEGMKNKTIRLQKEYIEFILDNDQDPQLIQYLGHLYDIKDPDVSEEIYQLIRDICYKLIKYGNIKDHSKIMSFMNMKIFYLGLYTFRYSKSLGIVLIFRAISNYKFLPLDIGKIILYKILTNVHFLLLRLSLFFRRHITQYDQILKS